MIYLWCCFRSCVWFELLLPERLLRMVIIKLSSKGILVWRFPKCRISSMPYFIKYQALNAAARKSPMAYFWVYICRTQNVSDESSRNLTTRATDRLRYYLS